jgi:FKBP-type peptidyl-prolyl isomerase-like protein
MTMASAMKFSGLVIALCLSLYLAACGESGAEAGPTKPVIKPPDKLPKELVIRDRTEGTGPAARAGDKVAVEYFAVDETGRTAYSSWDDKGPAELRFRLGAGDYFDAFEEGIEGMKLGGRREVLMPAKSTVVLGPLFYVIDMLELNG